ncbi:putative zinc finger motif, C2HC5-type-domain-containing protein [Radiomyces spectabilis]|uniref:putative zinc finger motif, C2HC5-type-domain-containing protein n=1 Tax=Radiomyces spectabilis TaxID=64574 RepID=UPI00221FFE74|nr:putative zinc finger motif, C2HC5-type-domain-containing protein [Radiomyces spectabilis]KAI8393525.1 putative zinc finger motif, C2HC5-type-domain-containing protein [Radiomyces spectabilis]
MSFEDWAEEQLSIFLGFDPETLQSQVIPYLLSADSPQVLRENLQEMVGHSEETAPFIQEFVTRRFASQKNQKKDNKGNQKPEPPRHDTREPTSQFPSLPATESNMQWPSNINVYVKKEKDDDYYMGRQKHKKGKAAASGSSQTSTESTLISDKLDKKKKKKPEMTLEVALKELDIKADTKQGKRRACQCQATKHPLLTIAPNCLNCGKIICTMEGPGPCTFCGTPVLSKEQQVALIAEAKKKRSEQKQLQHQQQQQRRGKAAPSSAPVRYASKVSGEIIPRRHDSLWDESKEEDQRKKAEEHKEKLLEFQRTSAQRSKIIDQATDFVLPTDQYNPWLSPQERALLLKKQQANMKKLATDGRPKRRVMTIDVNTKQVVVQDADTESSEEEYDEQDTIPTPTGATDPVAADSSAGTYANNPLLKGVNAPKFIGKSKGDTRGRTRRKKRIQYDDDDILGFQYASSVADDRSGDIVVESG